MEGVVDRDYPRGIVLGYAQHDETAFKAEVFPLLPQWDRLYTIRINGDKVPSDAKDSGFLLIRGVVDLII